MLVPSRAADRPFRNGLEGHGYGLDGVVMRVRGQGELYVLSSSFLSLFRSFTQSERELLLAGVNDIPRQGHARSTIHPVPSDPASQ